MVKIINPYALAKKGKRNEKKPDEKKTEPIVYSPEFLRSESNPEKIINALLSYLETCPIYQEKKNTSECVTPGICSLVKLSVENAKNPPDKKKFLKGLYMSVRQDPAIQFYKNKRLLKAIMRVIRKLSE